MCLFHRTYHGASILRDGFLDAEGSYLTDTTLRGVWLSDIPLDDIEGADGDQLLSIEIPTDVALEYEVEEEGKAHREFLIPAEILNRHGPPHLMTQDEEDAIIDPRFLPPDS